MLLYAAGPHSGDIIMQESKGFTVLSLEDSSTPPAIVELDDQALSQVAGSKADGPGATWVIEGPGATW